MSNPVATIEAEAAPSTRQHAFAKAKRWSGILAKFVSVQIIVQVIGLATGLFLVRTLSQHEYAFYTLANTMQATLIILADVGVGSALSATGGKVWQDKYRFGQLIQTGLYIRKRLGIIGGFVAVPVLLWLLIINGTSPAYAGILTLFVVIGAYFRLTNDVLGVVPRLRSRIDQLQKLDILAAVIRLILIGAAGLSFINAALGVLIASISLIAQSLLLRQWAAEGADFQAPTNEEDKKAILNVVKQTAPSTIYYCIQGQLTVFLISIFGNTNTIAQVGALGRFAIIFSVLTSLVTNVLTPIFARCQDRNRLKALYWQILVGYAMASLIPLAMLALFPHQALWLLGAKYGDLPRELLIVAVGAAASAVVGMMGSLNWSRAWVSYSWVYVPVTIGWSILLLLHLNVSRIYDAVLFGALSFVPGFIVNLIRALLGFRQMKSAQVAA